MFNLMIGKKAALQIGALCLVMATANCSGKTYSTFFQPFDLVFGGQNGQAPANPAVSGALIAATPLTNTRVMLTFSKPVTLASGQNVANYRIADANGNLLQILAASRDPNNSNIIFLDTIPQAAGTQYTATVSGIAFVDGASLGNASATFTAPNNADQTGPQFSSVTPLSATTVEVFFNEAVDRTTSETATNYDIYTNAGCSTGNVDVTGAVRDSANQAKVTLTSNAMTAGTTYYLCGTTNIRDMWGNPNTAVITSTPFVYNAPTPRVASVTSASPSTVLVTYTEDMDSTGIAGTALTNRTIYTINQCSGGGSLTLPTNGTVVGTRSVLFTGVTQTGTVNQGSCFLTVTIPGGTTCDTTAGLVCSAASARLTTAGNTGVLAYNNATTNDTTPPAIIGVTTTNSTTVVVTFSENVTGVTTGDFNLSPALNITNVSCTGNVCTLTTDDQSTTPYTLSVNNSSGGIQDNATPANTLSSGSTTFTGDGKPYIVAIYPVDSGTVMVEWSEPIGNAASVGPADYSIAGATITAAALDPVGLDPSKFVKLTISPVLTSGTTYTLSVNNPTGSVDSSGNPTLGTVPNGGTFTGPTATTRPQLVSATSPSPTTVLVTFNEPLNNATIATGDFRLAGAGCPAVNPGGQTITSATQIQAGVIQLVLAAGVAGPGAACQVVIPTLDALSDLAGNGNAALIQLPSGAEYVYTGTGSADTTPPTIASVISLSNTRIQVFFSEPMKTGANGMDTLSRYSTSPALTLGPVVTCVSNTTSCIIDTSAQSAQNYTLSISSGIEDFNNVPTTGTISSTFIGTGGSATAPTLFMATLINSTTVELSFSEAMNLGTSQDTTKYNVTGGNTVTAAVRQADATKVRLTITPGAYGSSNTYIVTASGVTDQSGNTIGSPNSATFSGSGTAPSTASLATASDTGTAGDNITGVNLTSPGLKFTGNTTPNTTVVLYHSPGVSFTDAGDLVTLNSHGLANGTAVTFTTINSTTGIATNTTYYVINATANTFQLATTPGGAVVPLTTDGTGILNTPIPYATAVSGPLGDYTVTVPSTATIPQGTNQFNIATVGPTGLVSDLSQTFSITYDSTNPVQPTSLTLVTASDTGINNSDRITNGSSLQFSVNCEVGATVVLRNGTTDISSPAGGSVCPGTATITLTTTSLTAAGQTGTAYPSINVIQTDVAGNPSTASANLSVTVDTTAPGLTSSNLTSNTTLTLNLNENAYNVSGGALTTAAFSLAFAANGGTATGASITGITHTAGSSTVTLTIAVTGTVGGTETITVDTVANSVYDTAGNASAFSTGAKTLSAIGIANITGTPAYTAIAPVSGGTTGYIDLTWSEGVYTNTGASGGVVAGDFNVTFVQNSGNSTTAVISCVTTAPSTTCPGTAPAAGATAMRLIVTNTGVTSGVETIQVNAVASEIWSGTNGATPNTVGTSVLTFPDRLAPNAPASLVLAAADDTGASNSDRITSQTTALTISGTSEANVTVRLYQPNSSGALLATATADGAGNWSADISLAAGSTYTVVATARDAALNVSADSTALSITIDTTASAATGTPDLTAATDSGSSSTDDLTNNSTPQFTVSCVTGESVQLYDGGVATGTAGTCAGATVTLTAGTLSGGAHTITARQTDAAGNQSVASTGLAITIDTTADAATGTPDLTSGTDTGSSNSDDLTNNATPQFTVSCVTGSSVQLYDGVTATGSAGTCAGSTVTLTAGTLGTGAHSINARQTDPAGNQSVASSNLSITIDTTADAAPGTPDMTAATDSGSSSTDNITSNTTPSFDVSCVTGSSVQLFDNLTATGSAVTCAGGTATLTAATLSAGTHASMNAKQTDAAGNVSAASGNLSITIDTTADAAPGTPDMTAATDLGSSSTDNLTSNATPDFTVTCVTGSSVQLFDNLTATGSAVTCAGGTATLTAATLSAGTHASMNAKQTDPAGNVSVASGNLSITIDTTADAAPGTPDMTAATDLGSSSSDDITSNATPQFTVSCVTGSSVQLFDNLTATGSVVTCAAGTATLTAGTLSAGTHASMNAKQTDPAGNVSAASGNLSITIDTTADAAPGIPDMTAATDTGSSSSDDITSNTTPQFTVSCVTGSSVQLFDNVTATGSAVTCAAGTATLTAATLSSGAHSINAKQTDVAGNLSVASSNLSITIDTTADAAPGTPDLQAASDTGTSSTDDTTKINTPSFTVSCVTGSSVQLYDNVTATGSAVTCAAGTATLTAATLSDGTHASINARQTDPSGNLSAASSNLSVVIDTAAPTNQNTVYAASSAKTGGGSVTIVSSGTASNEVWFAPSGTTTFTAGATMTKAASGTATSILAPATAGSYKLFVLDLAGNISSESTATLTVDNTAPSGYSVAIDQTAINNANKAAVSFTFTSAEVGATYNYTISSSGGGTNVTGSATVSSAGQQITGINTTGLGDGTLTLSVTLTDPAGNVGTAATNNKTKDTVAPTITSTAPATGPAGITSTTVSFTYSENCATATITWERTGGTADSNHVQSLTGSELNSGAHTSIVITNNPTLVDGSIYSVKWDCTDAAGNAATQVVAASLTYSSGPPTIQSAQTLDTDNNGKIDTYRLAFNKNVSDATFPGYAANSLGTATANWLISGYTNVRLIHGSAVTFATDTANDAVIYVRFDENLLTCSAATQVGCDTAAKPDLTTTATPGLTDGATPMAQANTGTVTEADGARPILVAARSLGLTSADAIFSETVETVTAQTIGNYVITLNGGLTVSAAAKDGTNTNIVHLTTSTQTGGTNYLLTVNTNVKDLANFNLNPTANTANFTGVTNPVVSSIVTKSATTLLITFNEVVTEASSICSTLTACAAIYSNTSLPVLTAVAANSSGVATPGNSQYFLLTVNPMIEGQAYTTTVTQNTVTSVATGFKMQNTNNSATFNGDGKPAVTISTDTATECVTPSNLPPSIATTRRIVVQYDQVVGASALTAANYTIANLAGGGCVTGTCSTGLGQTASNVYSMGGNKYAVDWATGFATDSTFQLSVANVLDANGNAVPVPTTRSFQCGTDTTGPILTQVTVVSATAGSTVLLLTFSEAVDNVTGNTATNYKFDTNAYGLNVNSAARQTNTAQVQITFSPAIANGGHQLTVQNVRDLATNPINTALGTQNVQPFIVNAPTGFSGGPVFDDPFGDGTPAGQIVRYNNKLLLGWDNGSSKLFEMDNGLTTAQTIAIDVDGSPTTAYTPLANYGTASNYKIDGVTACAAGTNGTANNDCGSGTIVGIDTIASICAKTSLSGSAWKASLTGAQCRQTGAGNANGIEYLLLGGYKTASPGFYKSYFATTDTSDTTTHFTFDHRTHASNTTHTYRTMTMVMFTDWLYIASPHQGQNAPQVARICMNTNGCNDGTARTQWTAIIAGGGTATNLYPMVGKGGVASAGSSPNGGFESTAGNTVSIDVMHEYDNDGASANVPQLYMANGGRFGGTIGFGTGTTRLNRASGANALGTDGGIIRSRLARSTAASPPGCHATNHGATTTAANCLANGFENITPTSANWLDYMSIPLPFRSDANVDWGDMLPSNRIIPAIKAVPYMRTAPNGDLYMIRNACATHMMQTKCSATTNTPCSASAAGDAAQNTRVNNNFNNTFSTTGDGRKQVCPPGYEVPQLWVLPAKGAAGTNGGGDGGNNDSDDWKLVASSSFTPVSYQSAPYNIAGAPASLPQRVSTTLRGNTATCVNAGTNRCERNAHLTLLEFVGNYLYIGFDNQDHGANIWRVDMAGGTCTGAASCMTSGNVPAESSFQIVNSVLGLDGSSVNQRIFSHVTVTDSGTDWLILVTRDGSNAMKIYRTANGQN